MKQIWKEAALTLAFGILLPSLLVSLAVRTVRQAPAAGTDAAASTAAPQVQQRMIRVLQLDGTAQQMELEAYVAGVVLREMLPEFELEAKKAQAVAARTFALMRCQRGNKHGPDMICTDPACCQAYMAGEKFLERGGSADTVAAAQAAAQQTCGQVLTYGGELIEATYFSCSGGHTEDAAAVWGADVPYLRAVESPGEEAADHYATRTSMTTEEFLQKLGLADRWLPTPLVGAITRTSGNGVATVELGGEVFTGTQVRSLLDLKSTNFTLVVTKSQVVITTFGYGHRVGMSQYGADAMALAGSDYLQILAHYYPGTAVQHWIDKAGDLE